MGKPRKSKSSPPQAPVVVEFDAEARHEYLTGFRKRKLERKKKCQEKAQVQVKKDKAEFRRKKKENMRGAEDQVQMIEDVKSFIDDQASTLFAPEGQEDGDGVDVAGAIQQKTLYAGESTVSTVTIIEGDNSLFMENDSNSPVVQAEAEKLTEKRVEKNRGTRGISKRGSRGIKSRKTSGGSRSTSGGSRKTSSSKSSRRTPNKRLR